MSVARQSRSYLCGFFFFKQKTAYEMRISDWSSDVCSSDLWAAFWLGSDDVLLVAPLNESASVARLLGRDGSARRYERRAHSLRMLQVRKIGRASFRERVCQYV